MPEKTFWWPLLPHSAAGSKPGNLQATAKGSDLLPPAAGTEASACPHTAAGSKSKALRSTELAPGGRDG